ncbi:protein atonal homolog 8, partial [Cricetulus griseus]|uniref:protein atonal homolog 8 n=1 Tax=Cricetulus griseus TaxID=10029 RepID=UPI0007DA63BC
PTPPPPSQSLAPGRPEVQPYREPALRPRILLCAPPARPTPPVPPEPPAAPRESPVRPAPPTRPGESSYSSISHVIYNNHPDSSASPRKRPGEATAASTEIKALQQTRRLLANARERTRVHTISAAFEALRKQGTRQASACHCDLLPSQPGRNGRGGCVAAGRDTGGRESPGLGRGGMRQMVRLQHLPPAQLHRSPPCCLI